MHNMNTWIVEGVRRGERRHDDGCSCVRHPELRNSLNKATTAKTPAASPPTELVLMYVGSPITSEIKSLSWSPQLWAATQDRTWHGMGASVERQQAGKRETCSAGQQGPTWLAAAAGSWIACKPQWSSRDCCCLSHCCVPADANHEGSPAGWLAATWLLCMCVRESAKTARTNHKEQTETKTHTELTHFSKL